MSAGASHEFPIGSPDEWLEKAVNDLHTARREFAVQVNANYDACCYHAQQSIEKVVKGALVSRGQRFPKTHDLRYLWELLKPFAPDVQLDVRALGELSTAAIEVRYPGYRATRQDAQTALDVCEAVWVQVHQLLAR